MANKNYVSIPKIYIFFTTKRNKLIILQCKINKNMYFKEVYNVKFSHIYFDPGWKKYK